METRVLPDTIRAARLNAAQLRECFLVDKLFAPGETCLVYTFLDRMIVGSVVPTGKRLKLSGGKELASEFFAERREVGVLNLGSRGMICVDGRTYEMAPRDGLYIGRGAKQISFESGDPGSPAKFYLASFPAHASHADQHIEASQTDPLELGSDEKANRRTIYKYIHSGGVKSCQLVMGITALAKGSVWNTMPTHTHPRRVEAYLYFGMSPDTVIFHLMGEPGETRHIVVRNEQVALSPSWSIHSGCGTDNYSFAWAMGGENQQFDDMDAVGMDELA